MVIERILRHLKQKALKADSTSQYRLPSERAPPLSPSLFPPSQARHAALLLLTLVTISSDSEDGQPRGRHR